MQAPDSTTTAASSSELQTLGLCASSVLACAGASQVPSQSQLVPLLLLLLLLLQALQLDLSGASVAYYSLPALAVLVSAIITWLSTPAALCRMWASVLLFDMLAGSEGDVMLYSAVTWRPCMLFVNRQPHLLKCTHTMATFVPATCKVTQLSSHQQHCTVMTHIFCSMFSTAGGLCALPHNVPASCCASLFVVTATTVVCLRVLCGSSALQGICMAVLQGGVLNLASMFPPIYIQVRTAQPCRACSCLSCVHSCMFMHTFIHIHACHAYIHACDNAELSSHALALEQQLLQAVQCCARGQQSHV
jgi:hypothetical protein